MSEKCPVCKTECESGATVCLVCKFAYKPRIDMTWPIPEDAKNWLAIVVKPYRARWEAKKREAELLAQLEEAKKQEADLLAQLENAKKQNPENSFTDLRDGKVYRTVKIGSQVWMAENLTYNAHGSKFYDNDPKNGEKYGRLYDWNMAMKACPVGWHLPSKEEWNALSNFAEGEKIAGKHLKAKDCWNSNGNGQDTYGFAAFPGGYGHSDGSFYDIGKYCIWWSSSECGSSKAYHIGMRYLYESVELSETDDKRFAMFSVRCLQDERSVW